MENNFKQQVAKHRVSFFVTESEYRQFYAYAFVKGFGTNGGIANLARTAIVDKISRNAPTEAQQRQIEEIIGRAD
jgi:hypothetical protein